MEITYTLLISDSPQKSAEFGQRENNLLFPDKAAATAALKKMKSSDGYTWNCEVGIAEFMGWTKKK